MILLKLQQGIQQSREKMKKCRYMLKLAIKKRRTICRDYQKKLNNLKLM